MSNQTNFPLKACYQFTERMRDEGKGPIEAMATLLCLERDSRDPGYFDRIKEVFPAVFQDFPLSIEAGREILRELSDSHDFAVLQTSLRSHAIQNQVQDWRNNPPSPEQQRRQAGELVRGDFALQACVLYVQNLRGKGNDAAQTMTDLLSGSLTSADPGYYERTTNAFMLSHPFFPLSMNEGRDIYLSDRRSGKPHCAHELIASHIRDQANLCFRHQQQEQVHKPPLSQQIAGASRCREEGKKKIKQEPAPER